MIPRELFIAFLGLLLRDLLPKSPKIGRNAYIPPNMDILAEYLA